MDMASADAGIKKAWVAGVISGVITLIVTAAAMAGYSIMGFTSLNLLDVAFIFGLTFGIYKKSRTCAVLMFVYFVGSKLYLWSETGKVSGLPLALIFGYYFFLGILGAFAYHRMAPQEEKPVQQSGSGPVPKFKTREEYQQWKAERLAGTQGAPLTGQAAGTQRAEKTGSGLGWVVAILLLAAAAGVLVFTDIGKTMVVKFTAGSKPVWQEFSSPEGNFAVLMPGSPSHEIKQVKTALGALDMHMFSREIRRSAYIIIYSDYPEIITRAPADKVLDGGRDGAVANSKGRLISEQYITLDGGHAGRELTIEVPEKGTLKVRAYLVGRRLYQIMVASPKDLADSEENIAFLRSFKLLTR